MIVSQIRGIAAYQPEERLNNKQLVEIFPSWTEEKIKRKLGIMERPIAGDKETAVDFGVAAAERLLSSGVVERDEIDYIVLCTQSPDYILPTSACLIQSRLGLKTSCGALDINLGCSGFVYGLGLSKGLLETGQARKVLLITAETYSKYINPNDRVTRPLFADGAAATLVEAVETNDSFSDARNSFGGIGPFEYGSDGSRAKMLIVEAGASRTPSTPETAQPIADSNGGVHSQDQLMMNGPGIFTFSLNTIPPLVKRMEAFANEQKLEIDSYILHQANKFMLDSLREEAGIPQEKFFNNIEKRGNTVSSTIPIAIIDAVKTGLVKPGSVSLLVGFGVGLSWSAGLIRFPENFTVVPLEQ